MADRQVRYCTSADGTRIAYRVEGDGPPVMWMTNLVESFTVEHLNPWLEEIINAIGRGRMMIRFDPRGIGMSDRQATDYSLAAGVSDVAAVIREFDPQRKVSLVAPGLSGLRAISYTAHNYDRVASLVTINGFARVQDVWSKDAITAFAALARNDWHTAAQAISARVLGPEWDEALVGMYRRSTTGEIVSRMFLANSETDVTDSLGSITVPTLVLHHPENVRIPLSQAQSLAAEIPNARLVPINVYTPKEFVKVAVDSIVPFLDQHDGLVLSRGRQSVFRTVLFTDLVGHTEMMSRLGDDRGRDVLREHERIIREVLKANGGTEVKTMGDGFMASFGSVTKAVECAVALQRAFEARNAPVGAPLGDGGGVGGAAPNDATTQNQHVEPLNVRVGLNAGEPIEEDGDLFGATVILASRIAAKAEGGEILVANAVRELCSGKGFLFADRGEFVAKGFDEAVRVYEVNWRD